MKILIVTEELNSVVWTFAKSLQQQKQDVMILTTRGQEFETPPNITVLTPFRKWSLIEGARLVPRLIQWNPDIFHFFYANENHHPRAAQWVIATFVAGLPHKTLAASFFAEGNVRTYRDRAFLKLFDVNTFGTRTQLMRLKRKGLLPADAIAEVLPPIEAPEVGEQTRVRPEVVKLIETLDRFVLVPERAPKTLDPGLFRERGLEVLALSERFRPRSWHYSTGPLNAAELNFVFGKARALLAADCDLSVLELRRYKELCERNQLPVVVTAYQNELLPGLCWNGQSGWVLDQGLAGLEAILDEFPDFALRRDYGGFSGLELVDNTMNELLRLYQRAFRLRWT